MISKVIVFSTVLVILSVFSLQTRILTAQSDNPGPYMFDVSAIRKNLRGGPPVFAMGIYGTLRAKNAPVRLIIQWVYQVEPFQIVGAPSWVTSDGFDIEAKGRHFDHEIPSEELQAAVSQLLVGRFAFEAHRATVEGPVLALVLSGKALKLQPAAPGDGCYVPSATITLGEVGSRYPCDSLHGSNGQASGRKVSMRTLAHNLEHILRVTVVDKTGLGDNLYDFNLKWTPNKEIEPGVRDRLAANPSETPAPAEPGPTLYDALGQLGLQLRSERGPVKIVVVDHVERPSDN